MCWISGTEGDAWVVQACKSLMVCKAISKTEGNGEFEKGNLHSYLHACNTC